MEFKNKILNVFDAVSTFYYCLMSGVPYNKSWKVKGRLHVIRRAWLTALLFGKKSGSLVIGDGFRCNNSIDSNEVGIIQPCVFNIYQENCIIEIGNNVGISGSTLSAVDRITIGDNVLIGSGCLITDNDSHALEWEKRKTKRREYIKHAPILISDNAFIGARCIILKGVTVGKGSVIGAGSVVSKDVPDNCVVCGNPAQIVKRLK